MLRAPTPTATPTGRDAASDGGADDRCPGGFVGDDFEGARTVPWQAKASGNATVRSDTVRPRGGARVARRFPRCPPRGVTRRTTGSRWRARVRSCELDVFATATVDESDPGGAWEVFVDNLECASAVRGMQQHPGTHARLESRHVPMPHLR